MYTKFLYEHPLLALGWKMVERWEFSTFVLTVFFLVLLSKFAALACCSLLLAKLGQVVLVIKFLSEKHLEIATITFNYRS